mgnify:CR=1 FL=1
MNTVSFIKAGDTEEKAIDFVCELTGKITYKNFSLIDSVSYTHLRAHETG